MAEPITALTDFAIALEAALYAVLLLRFGRIERLWAAAFACVSLAACLGSLYHGFAGLELPLQRLLWHILAAAMGAASCFILIATSQTTLERRLQRSATLMALGKLVVYLAAVTVRLNFAYIVADYALALIFVLLLELVSGLPRKRPGAAWIVTGVCVSAIALIALAAAWSGIAMFRPVDIYHLVQMVALSCFYLGVWLNVPDPPSKDPLYLK